MKIAVRRRLAAAAVLSMTATVAAVSLTVGTSSAAINGATPNHPGNYPGYGQPVTVTFTTGTPGPSPLGDGGSPVPVGSDVVWQLPGGNSFQSTVETVAPNSSGGQTITTTVDFTDVGDPSTSAATGAGFFGGNGPADPGVYDVTIKSADPSHTVLQNCAGCVTVVAAGPPTLTSADPNAVAANTTDAKVTFKGANFSRSTAFRVLPVTGNSATDVKIVLDTSTNAPAPSKDGTTWYGQVTVPAGATLGLHDVQVTNTDGQTSICTGCFTVLGANLTGVTPTVWTNNDTDSAVSIKFTGPSGSVAPDAVPSLQFVGDPGAATKESLTIPATTVTARAADGTSITATYNLAAAAPGNDVYQPRLQSPAGVTTNVCTCRFSVQQPGAPTVTSISPSSQTAGTTQQVTVGGTNFAKGTNVTIAGGGVTTTAVEYVSRTQIKATLAVASTATGGKRDVTVTLTDGQKSTLTGGYTITPGASASSSSSSSSGTPCASSSASASPSRSATASPTSSATATAGLAPQLGIRATSSPSDTATASTSPTASASRSASSSGTPSGCAPLQIAVSPSDIVPTQASTVFIKGSPGQQVELYAYTRPNTAYGVVRSGRTNTNGALTFSVTPGANTRLYAHYVGSTSSTDSPSVVINVHTSLSLSAYRDGVRKYHFQGTNLPRRPGQLITLYRYAKGANLDQYCVPPAESDVRPQANNGCTAIRTATAYTNSSNVWRIDRTFTGSGQFYFVVRTSQTLTNGRGHSNQRLTVIH